MNDATTIHAMQAAWLADRVYRVADVRTVKPGFMEEKS